MIAHFCLRAGINLEMRAGINLGDMSQERRVTQVGPEDHVICALSGGVDSTVAATLVHKVLQQAPPPQ